MINYIVKFLALGMIIVVLSRLFPNFWGGFYSCIGVIIFQLGLTLKITKKEDNERS